MDSTITPIALVIHRQDTDISSILKVFSIRGTQNYQKISLSYPPLQFTMFSTGKISPKKLEDIMNTMLEMAGLHLFPQWDLLRKCQLGHGQIICLSSPYGFLAYIPILKELR